MSSSDTAMGRIADSAETARDQLLRCRGITQHFLKLSRGQGQASHLVSLEPTIAAVTRLIEPTARSYSVSVRAHAVPEGLHVRANEAELQHVLLNLLLNAVQASERGAEVELAVRSGDPVRILVTDNGPGIAPENRRRIFEPFFSGRRGGTGLGLYLSLDFVRNWGGEIRVESTPGHGATFEVVLPAEGGTR
jgi:two-component system NtrC family sensor kinase